jgi:hypothetical protein
MQGRAFLDLAREVIKGSSEQHWRGAVIHAYYGLMLECREALIRWGRPVPPRQSVHQHVRQTFVFASRQEVKDIGFALDDLVQARNWASYDLTARPEFSSDANARAWLQQALDALALLDAIEIDPTRRAAAIASLPPPVNRNPSSSRSFPTP